MIEIHLVMLRYTMDNSPLDVGGEYAEMVRYAFADRGNAELVANQMNRIPMHLIPCTLFGLTLLCLLFPSNSSASA